ncbi:MAG: flagellar basal body P-ring protein FlgI [Legionellales bacterium]|nr:flagellar basal body P-ring protein FlgI [Legionellales bacterium]
MQKILILVLMISFSLTALAERIKDIATLAGARENQLVGYGLVVGLNNTGDRTAQAPFTNQSFLSMLKQFDIRLPPNANLQIRNIAAVAVTAKLPPFVKNGQTIDITISSIGNATSLQGGTLLLTPLKGADGTVYAVAQGNVVVSGIGAQGADGSKITVNSPSSASIPNGATVERNIVSPYLQQGHIIYNLFHPDFTTAKRMADVINIMAQKQIAIPLDAASVQIRVPQLKNGNLDQRFVGFIAEIENLTLEPAESAAKIVINSRTGTIVIGQNVRVTPAAVSHGNLIVTITENQDVSQPNPLSGGETAVTPESEVQVVQQQNRAFIFEPGTSLRDIVHAINKVGAAPGDLVAILEALKAVGALKAELVII